MKRDGAISERGGRSPWIYVSRLNIFSWGHNHRLENKVGFSICSIIWSRQGGRQEAKKSIKRIKHKKVSIFFKIIIFTIWLPMFLFYGTFWSSWCNFLFTLLTMDMCRNVVSLHFKNPWWPETKKAASRRPYSTAKNFWINREGQRDNFSIARRDAAWPWGYMG